MQPRVPPAALVVAAEDELGAPAGTLPSPLSASPDPRRIATPTLSNAPPGGRRVFSFSSALDVSGASLDSVPETIPELPLVAIRGSEGAVNKGDGNPGSSLGSESSSENGEPSSVNAADFSFEEENMTIHQLDLESSCRSESPNSSSMEYSSRTLALFRVDVKLDDSRVQEKPAKTRAASAAVDDNAMHRHKNDKWVRITRQAQQRGTRKRFHILLRWPSKVFGGLMLIFSLVLLVTLDERRLVALNLSEDRYVNTTNLCVDKSVRLSNYVASKGNTWVILLANVAKCGKSRATEQNMTFTHIVAACLCTDPRNDLIGMAKNPSIRRSVASVQSQCSDVSQCLQSWDSSVHRSLVWAAGPNGKFMHGETIPLPLGPVLPTSSQKEPTGVIWGGESPAPTRLRELDALVIVACIAIFLTILWFTVKVMQHRKDTNSLSHLYGIS